MGGPGEALVHRAMDSRGCFDAEGMIGILILCTVGARFIDAIRLHPVLARKGLSMSDHKVGSGLFPPACVDIDLMTTLSSTGWGTHSAA